ncbi:MAG: hypothetical protein AB1585_04050 [Thermodesulfobacteriota bacterium]
MKHSIKMFFSVIISLLFLALIPFQVFPAGTTARAGLEQAQQAAKKWKADALLVGISTYGAAMDGTSSKWTYAFFSPKANQGYMIDIREGNMAEPLEVRPHIKGGVGTNFLDSPRIMEEAKKNGLKIKGKPILSLLVMGQATGRPGPYWTVGGDFSEGEVSVIIDAKTGGLLKKQTH